MTHFTFEQAQALMPQVRQLTAEAVQRVEDLATEISRVASDDPEREELGDQIRSVIEAWARDIVGLGAEVKGLWLVDFDSGAGYYCWKHPEESLEYFHGYDEGFAGRHLITPTVLH